MLCIKRKSTTVGTYIRLFESLVNWHFTLRLVHSEQLVLSVASHSWTLSFAFFHPMG